jgi:hypothetical protein
MNVAKEVIYFSKGKDLIYNEFEENDIVHELQ